MNRYFGLICFAFVKFSTIAFALEDIVCGGFDMRNSPNHFISTHGRAKIEGWKNCTVIEGDVRYILMTNQEGTSVNKEDFEAVVLPNVREITGSLMVFQVVGLESLGVLLPNLRIIRGNSMVFNYAFVLFQNPDLKDIGLTKLAEISKGGVRLASNGALCYANTINWTEICRDKGAHIFIENNQDPNNCADKCKNSSTLCSRVRSDLAISDTSSMDLATTGGAGSLNCWNYDQCQLACPSSCTSRKLSCDLNQNPPICCHKECAGGCVGPNATDCYACRHVNVDGRCERKCPDGLFMIQGRRCITDRECRRKNRLPAEDPEHQFFKTFDGICDNRCPQGYETSTDQRKCVKCSMDKPCTKKCTGGGAITNLEEAKSYKDCNIITTSLEINIQSGLTKNVVQELEDYLGDIHEVYDFVKISFSPSLVSLSMLKNLQTIHGRNLLNGKYALSVFENQNLAQLWNSTGDFKILHGTIQFHNNPRLCYQTIIEMIRNLGLLNNTSEHDVSQFSNGNKAVCDELDLTLKLSVITDEHAVFSWDEFSTNMMDHRMFLGYQLYYRPVETEDVNVFDGRDACHDSWHMTYYESDQRGALVGDLKPHTLYAFYLTTLMVNSPGAKGGMSKIVYQRTKFRYPSQPRITRIESTAHLITVEWEPPSHPNGEVTHYMIQYVAKRDVLPKERNYCDEPPTYGASNDTPLGDSTDHKGTSPNRGGIWAIPSSTANTCAEHQCCQCLAPSSSNSTGGKVAPDQQAVFDQKERASFENAIHNIIFVHSRRRKRESGFESTDPSADNSYQNWTLAPDPYYSKPVAINVTGFNFSMTNLHHFTSYEIRIWACQNTSVPENYCSQQEVLKTKRTSMIKSKDSINASSIRIVNETSALPNVRYIQWIVPEDPNGVIVGYKIEYVNQASTSLAEQTKTDCVTTNDYVRRGSFVLSDLTPGNWSVRIAALSLAQRGEWSQRFYFVVPEPYKFSNTLVIGIAIVCSLAITAVVAFLSITIYRRNFRKKLPEYLMNVFSANPEYISQLEVYKPDEWELRREDIELLHEIGRGTFGTVYAGTGKKVKSACGDVFGECAVKTVSERASIYDRWHFLIEASVMKQFNVAHIVKLYGVVSEGQPALVVMEIMHKGNLRDYLRSRRPNAEENVDGLQPPTLKESLQWAGEIADGMSYLEAQKFCHRDLAARNCMVTSAGSCKIGDFGMARDVYVKDYYRPTGRRLMPVRWMSPEALKDAIFTSKSDIWSYGVVLWEIATLASQPYAGLSNEDVIRFVVDERRKMEMPTGCPSKLYQMMSLCWKYDPKERPTFADIIGVLLPDMSEHFKQVAYLCNQRGKELRSSSSSSSAHNQHSCTNGGNAGDQGGGAGGSGNRYSSHLAPQSASVSSKSSLSKKYSIPPTSDSDLEEPICQNNRRGGSGSLMNSPVVRSRKMSNSEPISLALSSSASPNGGIRADHADALGCLDEDEPPVQDRRPSNEKLLLKNMFAAPNFDT